jgi:hypothetical protein
MTNVKLDEEIDGKFDGKSKRSLTERSGLDGKRNDRSSVFRYRGADDRRPAEKNRVRTKYVVNVTIKAKSTPTTTFFDDSFFCFIIREIFV